MAMRTMNSFLGTESPEPFDTANDNWNDYVKQFKYFFL